MDYAFLKWIGEALGPWAPLVILLMYYANKNQDNKPDVAKELLSKIDGIDSKVVSMGERVARIEGKLSND